MQRNDIEQTAKAVYEELDALEKALCGPGAHDSGKVANAINQLNKALAMLAPLTRLTGA